MSKRRIDWVISMVGVLLLGMALVQGQQAPDMIVFNAKIVTVNDKGFESKTGTIAEAMAIRDGTIVFVGSNTQAQAQRGSNTTMVDLAGRTVLPGLIGVHEHPYDWTLVNPYVLKQIVTDDTVVTRVIDGSPEEQLRAYPAVLREAVAKASPGQWIYIVLTLGENYQYSSRGNAGLGGVPGQYPVALFGAGIGRPAMIDKADLDVMAPNNPVLLRDTFTQLLLNTKGLEEIAEVFPEDITSQINHENGIGGADPIRWVFTDVVMRDHYEELKEMSRLGLSWWAGYGMISFASAAYTPTNIRVFHELSQSDQMAMRNLWTWNWRNELFINDDYLLSTLIHMEGQGNNYFWNGGAFLATGLGCTVLEPRAELLIQQPTCGLPPGSDAYQLLYKFIKRGGRFVTAHFTADRDVDHLMDIVEQASQEAGFTNSQIRARRHTFDHIPILRPDQLERVKSLGMIPGGNSFEIYQSSPGVLKVYGEKAVDWVVPKNALINARIMSGFEVDRGLESTNLSVFWALARFITREAWDGKVYGQSEKISRELALKTATIWGAHYLAKEDDLGSLEVDKWADFIVLDRDYIKVPESYI
ncbi:MAG: amidohydrolase family protein [Acidobacteriota bacterium]|nr:amidohydrolase family protein [Acidobacteriota bacterium]